jgi:hypothetical protein
MEGPGSGHAAAWGRSRSSEPLPENTAIIDDPKVFRNALFPPEVVDGLLAA